VPLVEHGSCVAAATSHFYEFIEQPGAAPRLLHELEENHEYSVLLTTGGGLYRYRLGDRVRVTGFAENTPLLEFLGKEDGVSDLCGEKLSPTFVGSVLEELSGERAYSSDFAMLAPSQQESPRYVLFLQGAASRTDSRKIPTMRIAGASASWRRHAFFKSQAMLANAICGVVSPWASARGLLRPLRCIVSPDGKIASEASGRNTVPSRRWKRERCNRYRVRAHSLCHHAGRAWRRRGAPRAAARKSHERLDAGYLRA
jgi:hypothetical protein